MTDKRMTNKQFAQDDQGFQKACQAVGLPLPAFNVKHGSKTERVDHGSLGLGRQAGKWRGGCGLAYRKTILKNL